MEVMEWKVDLPRHGHWACQYVHVGRGGRVRGKAEEVLGNLLAVPRADRLGAQGAVRLGAHPQACQREEAGSGMLGCMGGNACQDDCVCEEVL